MQIHPSQSPQSHRKLPDRPDLDQLKKQAKELLAAYENAEPEAIAEVKRHFNIEPDQPLTLAQAQLVLARAYGFESWPKMKAFVDGVTLTRFSDAVRAGDVPAVRQMLRLRPELVNQSAPNDGERRPIHWAIINHDPAMLRVLLEHNADPRKGIWPHRESTTAVCMATERGLTDLLAIIDEAEAHRREEMSCPNVTISPEQEKLTAMIHSGRDDEAIALLEADPELMKMCDRDGASPLHVACSVANERIVDWLCEHRASAQKQDIHGHTPIDRAALALNWRQQERVAPLVRIMHRLRRRGCELTPHSAAALGDCDALRRLHSEGHPQFSKSHYFARGGPLTTAAMFGEIDSVACLLDLGLDVNEPIPIGGQEDEAWSWGGPLWHAAAFGRLEICKLLLDRGADPNANVYASGWPLDRAYERGDRAIVDLLYARGAKPSIYTVCNAHDLDAAKRIVGEMGDDANAMREMVWAAGCSISLPIFELALPRFVRLQDQLTPKVANLHDLLCQPMREGQPREAVRPASYRYEHRFTILQMMLDAGFDPNARGGFGLTALHFVAARNMGMPGDRTRFASILLDAGADPSLRDTLLSSTALGWACRYGREDLVEFCLARGVPAHEPDAPGWATPLAWAQKMGHASIASRLEKVLKG